MSTLWISRAINLLVFLPSKFLVHINYSTVFSWQFSVILSYLKPTSSSSALSTNAREISAELNFDRYLAAISLAVDGIADSLIAITRSKSQAAFVALSSLSSFTSGGNPALNSLGGVCLHACGRGQEVGALFGALGVLNALAHFVFVSLFVSPNKHPCSTFLSSPTFTLGRMALRSLVTQKQSSF